MSRSSRSNRRFGRLYSPDERDAKFKMRRVSSTRVSRTWNDTWWRGNQGATSSCVGHAWSHWLAAAPIRQLVNPIGLYGIAQHFDEWPDENYEGTSVRAGAKVLAMLGFISEYRWATSVRQMIPTLLEVGPVVVGTDWTEGMEEPDEHDRITADGDVLGGHAYLISAVNTNRKLLRITNSWCEEWGRNGRAWISFADMDRLLKADGEACLGVEAKPQ